MLTDNEIIKALECCTEFRCDKCVFGNRLDFNCMEELMKSALDLIKRQKAEIERLQSMNQAKLDMIHDIRAELETAKTEAYKELAEKLKEKAYLDGTVSITQELVVDVRDIDSLAEEMTVNYESSKKDKQKKEDEGK